MTASERYPLVRELADAIAAAMDRREARGLPAPPPWRDVRGSRGDSYRRMIETQRERRRSA